MKIIFKAWKNGTLINEIDLKYKFLQERNSGGYKIFEQFIRWSFCKYDFFKLFFAY